MEGIIYNDNIIHVFNDGTILAYVLSTDGDIEEVLCSSIENAKQRIDANNQYMEDEQ